MPEADVSIGVFAFGIAGLTEVMSDLGQPRFRAEQVARWIYERNVREYAEMTDLPAELREQLASDLPLARPSISQRQVSRLDGTIKYLVRMADGVEVETVALPTARTRRSATIPNPANNSRSKPPRNWRKKSRRWSRKAWRVSSVGGGVERPCARNPRQS